MCVLSVHELYDRRTRNATKRAQRTKMYEQKINNTNYYIILSVLRVEIHQQIESSYEYFECLV